jgi:hypothetical protein
LPAIGTTITFQWYANSSGNTWLITNPVSILITGATNLFCSQITYSTTLPNADCTFSALWQSNTGLSGSIFSINIGNGFTNYTWAAFQNNPDYATTISALPSNGVVYYQWFANDTLNNWATSGINSLSIASSSAGGGGGGGSIVPTSTPTSTSTIEETHELNQTAVIGIAIVIGIILVATLVEETSRKRHSLGNSFKKESKKIWN